MTCRSDSARSLRPLALALVCCALLAVAGGGSAAAADLPDFSLRGPLAPGPVRWDGLTIGGQVAYSSMNANFGNSTSSQIAYILRNSALEDQFAPSGWTTLPNKLTSSTAFGVFLGYNMQWDDLVLGGDISYNRPRNLEPSASDSITRIVTLTDGTVDTVTLNASSSLKLIDYATLRGRAGYAFGQFLPYAVLGGAVGRFNYTNTATVTVSQQTSAGPPPVIVPFGPVTQTDSQNNKFGYGFVYGLGMDIAITPNLFLRGEWEYVAFNKVGDIRSTVNTARVGLGWRF